MLTDFSVIQRPQFYQTTRFRQKHCVGQTCAEHSYQHVCPGNDVQLSLHSEKVKLNSLQCAIWEVLPDSLHQFLLIGKFSLDDTSWVASVRNVVVSEEEQNGQPAAVELVVVWVNLIGRQHQVPELLAQW